MKNITASILFILGYLTTPAQSQTPDTVEIELANTTKLVFTISDRSDIEQLKEVDFQALFDDILLNLENTAPAVTQSTADPAATTTDEPILDDEVMDNTDDMEDWQSDERRNRYPCSRQFINADLGMNNYLHDGKFSPDEEVPYSVRAWGSWYIGINAVHRFRFNRVVSMEASIGASIHNYKFDDDNTLVTRTEDGVVFLPGSENLSYTKSKLTISYLNASTLFVLNAGGRKKDEECHRCNNSNFRFGLGPYVGYRIGSYAKQQYLVDGEKESNRDRDHFYLNNIRYGIRLQLGVNDTDFFINYDLNKLFVDNKGPALNAYSFGIIF